MLHGVQHDRTARRDANFVVRMLNVVSDGALRDRQQPSRLTVGVPARDKSQDLHFATRQSIGPQSTASRSMTRCREDGFRGGPVESAISDLFTNLRGRLSMLESRPVWRWLSHRLVCVGSCKQAHGVAQLDGPGAAMVATAVRSLHGVPVTVKECFDVTGTPSTVGLSTRSGHRAASDAPVVARLRQAGAIILGKTNVSQLLMFVEADNPVYGRTNNPWNADRSAGGSSGGEGAIVAARGSALGLGTDIGGSVRVPAHCCGIHSIKPTPGRLSVEGTVDIIGAAARAAIPDSGGLLARHVDDLRLALNVLSRARDPRTGPGELRIGVYEDDGFFPASATIRRAVNEAAAALTDRGFQDTRTCCIDHD